MDRPCGCRHRAWGESSCPLGQVVSERGPRDLSVMDLDMVSAKNLHPQVLLRLIEHEVPGAKEKRAQRWIQGMLARIVEHARTCPQSPVALDPRSGVFLLRGHIHDEDDRLTFYPHEGKRAFGERFVLNTDEEFFSWLEGSRRGVRRGRR